MKGPSDRNVKVLDLRAQRQEIETLWMGLSQAVRGTYFLSWPWVENWLATLPDKANLTMVGVWEGDRLVAAVFLGQRRMVRNRVVPVRAHFLNATGFADLDEICIEHNGWLAPAGQRCLDLSELVKAIPGRWDELVLGAMDAFPAHVDPPNRIHGEEMRPCHFVDLAKVRGAAGGDYLSLLGGDVRSQIRRSIKLYQARGAIEVDEARSLDEARDMFSELATLHQSTWEGRGKPGAFAMPYFRQFHERLITERFAHGEIQLLRIRVGGTTLGCLYNFVWNGTVSFYQSGVAYERDNKLKPGLVCHVEAIKHNANRGESVYDFLAGDARYKRNLSTDASQMMWLSVQRPRIRFLLEDGLRKGMSLWRQQQEARAPK